MPLQSVYYDATQTSMATPSTMREMYIPLWMNSTVEVQSGGYSTNNYGVGKGSSTILSQGSTGTRLYKHNPDWKPEQTFCLEVSIRTSSTTGHTGIWDFTTSSIVPGSQIDVSNGYATVVRSGQFTLTPGRTYGVSFWQNTTSGSFYAYINKAQLVVIL